MESCGRDASDRNPVGDEIACPLRGQVPGPLGFPPQRPIKRAYEQSPAAVKTWLDESYLQIHQRAKAEGAEIHGGDETAMVNTDVRGRSYAPKGKTPVALTIGGTRHKLSMIASVTNQGKARWLIVDGNFNHERLIQFFDLLIKDTPRKVPHSG